ncbi:VOC family protein [Bradyrhizobium sp. USDA 4502]
MTSPVTGLDHIELLVPQGAIADYEALLDSAAEPVGNGVVAIGLGNVRIVLRPSSEADQLGLICFAIDEPARMARRLKRVGLATVENGADGAGAGLVKLDKSGTYSVPLGYSMARTSEGDSSRSSGEILGLDHVVIASRHSDRAAALYGARLGLDMRLDSVRADRGLRLMFFRCGDLVLEVVQNLREELSGDGDTLYGFSWRTRDADKTHARLSRLGFQLSEIRRGHRPGTRVFTVRNRTAGIPTLFLELPKDGSSKT